MSSSIFVDAPTNVVARLIEDASRWPEWSKVCTEVWDAPEDGEWRVGDQFGFKLRMARRDVPFIVTVRRFDRESLIEWTSTKFSITAVRAIAVQPHGDRTLVIDSKRFSSVVLPIGIAYPKRMIVRMTDSWLREIKAESESRHS
jgi:hypothetical protein